MLITPFLMARRGDVQISAERLKARREARFMSQAELAAAAGMGLSNVQRLERGKISAIMRTGIPKLAAALRLTDQEFMDQIAITVIGNDGDGHGNGVPEPTPPKEDPDAGAMSIVEFALKHKLPPGAIQRASQLIKQAASQSPAARAKTEKKKGK